MSDTECVLVGRTANDDGVIVVTRDRGNTWEVVRGTGAEYYVPPDTNPKSQTPVSFDSKGFFDLTYMVYDSVYTFVLAINYAGNVMVSADKVRTYSY